MDTWITRNGRQLKISEMTTSHILNCIELICRRYPWRVEYLAVLAQELTNR